MHMGIRLLPSGKFRLQIRRSTLKVDEVFSTLQEAEEALSKYTGASARQIKNARGPTLDEAWALYTEDRAFLEKRPNTRRAEETHVKPVLHALGHKQVKLLDADDVNAYIVEQTKAGKAPDTVRNAVAALSSILNYCRDRRLVATNVTIGVKRPRTEPTVKRMPAGHQGALMKVLGHPNYRYRAVARLALLVRETGARPGEWVMVEWDDVHLDEQRVVFRNTKYKRMPRTVPLTKAAMVLLTQQLEDITINMLDKFGASELVFPTLSKDGEITHIHYTGALRDMKKDNLIPKVLRAHNGRHEFISSLVESSDLDDSRIMSLVGHHSPASMQIYTHARNTRFLPQLEALEERRRKERAHEIAKAMGVPTAVIDAFLVHQRKAESADDLPDSGNELLYEADSMRKLSAVADKLGKTDSERMRSLLDIRQKIASKKKANNASE